MLGLLRRLACGTNRMYPETSFVIRFIDNSNIEFGTNQPTSIIGLWTKYGGFSRAHWPPSEKDKGEVCARLSREEESRMLMPG